MYNLMISGSRSIGQPVTMDERGRKLNDGETLAIKTYRRIRVGEYIEWALREWGLLVPDTKTDHAYYLTLVSGGAVGVDQYAEYWASMHRVPVKQFLPDWRKKGRAAGIIRNKEMLNIASMVVAIWDGQSAGTRHVIHTAREMNLPLIQVDWVSGRITRDGSKPLTVEAKEAK